MIDFTVDAPQKYPGEIPTAVRTAVASRTAVRFFHHPKVLNLITDVEQRYGFTRIGMTSWAGYGVAAYLSPAQIELVRNDPLVKLVSDNAFSKFSADPPWPNVVSGNETMSWGTYAVNGKVRTATNDRKVYIVDSGVAIHRDLPDTLVRTSVVCGSEGGCEVAYPNGFPAVGCFGHATHVAGIVGAMANDMTTAGVYAGANMVSLSVVYAYLPYSQPPHPCANSMPDAFGVANALDYIYFDSTFNNPNGLVNIANISINPAAMGFNVSGTAEMNWSRVRTVATPAYRQDAQLNYPGVFVAQSAGNQTSNACLTDPNNGGSSYAYRPFNYAPYSVDDDGIVVVGAVHHTGEAVSDSLPFSDTYPSGLANNDLPSNYGRCVDVWAPGNAIVSTWGNHTYPHTQSGIEYFGNPVSGDQGWGFLSGTSMAAPHVAGAAAYLADTFGLNTPAQIEQAVRQNSTQFNGNVDPSGQPVKIVQLP